ncbi:MAG: tetratricopeptide repeat protein [Polyangia bacterium]
MRGIVAGLVVLAAASGAARAGEGDMERARAYFTAGVDAYDQGKYEVALREFQNAHALSHSPALYFNMAACEEHLDHFQSASLLLRQYLIEKPTADDRDNVEQRIKSLEARDSQLKKMNEPPPPVKQQTEPNPVVAATPPPPKRHLKYAWVMLGVTAGVGAAAIGVGAYTVAHHSDLKNGCGNTIDGCSPGQISTLKSTAVATDVLIGVTAAAAVATVVFAVLETRKSHEHADGGAARVAFIGNGVRF